MSTNKLLSADTLVGFCTIYADKEISTVWLVNIDGDKLWFDVDKPEQTHEWFGDLESITRDTNRYTPIYGGDILTIGGGMLGFDLLAVMPSEKVDEPKPVPPQEYEEPQVYPCIKFHTGSYPTVVVFTAPYTGYRVGYLCSDANTFKDVSFSSYWNEEAFKPMTPEALADMLSLNLNNT